MTYMLDGKHPDSQTSAGVWLTSSGVEHKDVRKEGGQHKYRP